MKNLLKSVWYDESGQGLAEYALIIALVALVVIGALTAFGSELNVFFTGIADAFADL